MRKIIIVLIILLTSCTSFKNQRHILTFESELIDRTHTEKFTKSNGGYWSGQVYTPTYQINNKEILNKTILIPKEFEQDSLIKNTVKLINQNKAVVLEKALSNSTNNENLNFCKGLFELFKNNFSKALENFRKNENKKLDLINDIVILDCIYEINKFHKVNKPKSYYYNLYQSIIDNKKPNKEYLEIIKLRTKFIK